MLLRIPNGNSLWCADTRPVELLLAFSSLAFGLVLAIVPDVFATGFAFTTMAEVMPEHTWATLLISAATFKMFGFIINWRLWRWFGALLSLMVWGGIATSYLTSGLHFPSGWVYLLYAVACLWIIIRGPTMKGGSNGSETTSFGPATAGRRDRDFVRTSDPGPDSVRGRLRSWPAFGLLRQFR